MREKFEKFYKEHRGGLWAFMWLAVSLCKSMAWGYALGCSVRALIGKAKDKKSKLCVGIIGTVIALALNHLLAAHEARLVTTKMQEEMEKDFDNNI